MPHLKRIIEAFLENRGFADIGGGSHITKEELERKYGYDTIRKKINI